MKKYEYANIETSNMMGIWGAEHRRIINDYAKAGYRFVACVPTEIDSNGKIKRIDLVFEKDE